MEKYYKLLLQKKELNNKIRLERKNLHDKFYSINKKIISILTFIIVCSFFINLIALAMTNYLVVQKAESQNLQITILEVNPIQSEVNNFESHPKSKQLYFGFLFQALIWAVIIFCYYYTLKNISTELELYYLIFFVILLSSVTLLDLYNNFGYFLSKIF